jgi:hypothetical protein
MTNARRLVAVLLVTFTGVVFAQGGLEQEIRRLEQMEAEAVLHGDYAKLDVLWAKDFTVNSPFNEVSTGTRGWVRTGALVYASFVREVEAVLLRGDTVIVMGHETVVPKAPSPDSGHTLYRRFTNIWMKRDGAWRMAARHANVIQR